MAKQVAQIGETITGTWLSDKTFTGKVVKYDREMGYKLDTGQYVRTITHRPDAPKPAEKPAMKKWAEEHQPGYSTHMVLAGAYKGRGVNGSQADRGPMLSHAMIEGKDKTPCGKGWDRLSDIDERHAPSCARCAAAVSKLRRT